jgi:hypothetical protein
MSALGRRFLPSPHVPRAGNITYQEVRPRNNGLLVHEPTHDLAMKSGYARVPAVYRRRSFEDFYGGLVLVAVPLSASGADVEGSEFVLTEQLPRMQSRASVAELGEADAVLFAVKQQAGDRNARRLPRRAPPWGQYDPYGTSAHAGAHLPRCDPMKRQISSKRPRRRSCSRWAPGSCAASLGPTTRLSSRPWPRRAPSRPFAT